MAQLTPEQYRMTNEEMSTGQAGQTAYTNRIASLRKETPPTVGTSAGVTSGGIPLVATGTGNVTANTSGNQSEIDPSKGPTIGTDSASNVSATGTGLALSGQQTLEQLQKRIDELANVKETPAVAAEKKSVFDLIKKREDTVATQKSATEMRQEALTQVYQEMGVTPEQIQKIGGLIGEITAFNQQLADLDIKKQAAIDAVGQGGGMDLAYYGGEQNRIAKQYNREIAAKAATAAVKVQELQMIQGAYDDAKKTATEIVNLKTYDQQQELADIEWSLNAHQDLYNMLTKEEQTQWDRQYQTAKDALDTAKTEAKNVTDLMLQYPRAGILITDTPAEATAKATAFQSTVGTGLVESTVGNFRILKDAAGNIVSTREISDTTGGTKTLDILDVQRYNEAYPNAGVVAGDTKEQADAKVATLSQPKEWTDENLRQQFRDAQTSKIPYEQVLADIDANKTIQNKDRAKFIAAEMFGKVKAGTTFDQWKAGAPTPQPSGMTPEEYNKWKVGQGGATNPDNNWALGLWDVLFK